MAPPRILLDGFTGSGPHELGERLEPFSADYRMLMPDLRGHGLTS